MNQSRLSDYLDSGTGVRTVKGSSQAVVTPLNKGRKRREPHLQTEDDEQFGHDSKDWTATAERR